MSTAQPPRSTGRTMRPSAAEPAASRTLVLWCPDWPISALSRSAAVPLDPAEPVAIVHANSVVACSAAAGADGVRRGMRRRDAQALCPSLRIVQHDGDRDEREFSPLVSAIEELAPGVQVYRPGMCGLRVRGPARYYGGEDAAARTLRNALLSHGLQDVRAGIADGPFTAEQAARAAAPMLIVPPGASATFLAPLPVTALDEELADMLARLGLHTLGDFAALDVSQVRARLSERGAWLHALASGADSRPVQPRIPPPELERSLDLEPPLELADQVAFAVRMTADEVVAALAAHALVCTEVRIVLHDDRGRHTERVWQHPTCFDAAGFVDRVRWQLQSAWERDGLEGGIVRVRITPEAVDAAGNHQQGLFGQGPDARLHHALSRVQALLGHRGVLTPAVGGGRRLVDRQELVPWGDRVVVTRDRERPWPGSLPAPLPTSLPAASGSSAPPTRTIAVQVLTAADAAVSINDRGMLDDAPAVLVDAGRRRAIVSWAGPWPLLERRWDPQRGRIAHRLQAVDDTATAWLLLHEDDGWQVEGRYD